MRLERPGAAVRSLELDLPLPVLSARWLRSPFRAPTAPLQKGSSGLAADARSALAFSLDGRRLFVRLEGGAIAVYVVPNSPAAPASAPVILRPQRGGRLLAAAAWGKAFWGVELIGTKLWLYRLGKRGGVGWEREFALPEGLPSFVVSPHVSLVMRDGKAFEGPDRTYQPLAFLFVAPYFWALEAEGGLVAPYPGDAIGLAHGQRGQGAMLSYVGEGRELTLSTWAPIASDGELVAGLGQDASLTPRDVLFGEWGVQCLLAAQALDGAWQLARWDARATPRVQIVASISPPPGARAIGLASWPTPGEPALVTLNRGRRDFQYVAAGAAGLIVELPEAAADATFSSAARAIAYRTEGGRIVVHALGPGQDVLRLEPGSSGAAETETAS
ncbi:MAG: hypothetical protein MUF34_13105 [Polyangiaceae bacterium]|nr:hypothetical protein [Polyangiaceae bacterium]